VPLAARLRTLARNDVRLIGRDRFLLGCGAFILLVSVIVRLVIPPLTTSLAGSGFDLRPYYPLLSSQVAILTGPQLAGVVFGFTLLEAREDGTLKAILVSPLRTSTYMAYRVGAAMALSFLVMPAMALIVGVGVPPLGALLPITFVGALVGAIWTLFIATFSDNKVQAFALMKIVSGTGLIVLGAFFISEPWQFLAGAYPQYWVAKAYWVAEAGGSEWWIHLLVGAVTMLGALAYLVRRFLVVTHR